MVSGSGFGGWLLRRWRSMCASTSYRAVCWRRASLSSSARTAALTGGVTPAAAAQTIVRAVAVDAPVRPLFPLFLAGALPSAWPLTP